MFEESKTKVIAHHIILLSLDLENNCQKETSHNCGFKQNPGRSIKSILFIYPKITNHICTVNNTLCPETLNLRKEKLPHKKTLVAGREKKEETSGRATACRQTHNRCCVFRSNQQNHSIQIIRTKYLIREDYKYRLWCTHSLLLVTVILIIGWRSALKPIQMASCLTWTQQTLTWEDGSLNKCQRDWLTDCSQFINQWINQCKKKSGNEVKLSLFMSDI